MASKDFAFPFKFSRSDYHKKKNPVFYNNVKYLPDLSKTKY